MVILQDYNLTELTELLTSNYGVKPFVARQIFQWLNRSVDFDGMTNLSKMLREQLKTDCVAVACRIVQTFTSEQDGTQKFLFELFDGNVVEGVLMKYKYGNTLCVSSQVGCRMGCKFCASTLGGLVRNLSAGNTVAGNVRKRAVKRQRTVRNEYRAYGKRRTAGQFRKRSQVFAACYKQGRTERLRTKYFIVYLRDSSANAAACRYGALA